MEEFCGSKFWDLNRTWYTENPEFTECFENTVFVYIPCIFLWIFTIFDVIFMINSKYKNVPWSLLNILKLSLICIIILIEIWLLITALTEKYFISYVVSPIVKILTFALAGGLIYYNRKRGFRTSGLLFLFWLLFLICGIPRFKKEIQFVLNHQNGGESIYIISYIFIFLSFILSCLVDKPPRKSEYEIANPCPEVRSSFPSKITFNWFTSTIWKGFRKPLDVSDLWDLNYEISSKGVVPVFEKYWLKAAEKNKSYESIHEDSVITFKGNAGQIRITQNPDRNNKNVSVFFPLIKAYGLTYLFAAVLDLIQMIFTFVSPQVLSLLIAFVSGTEEFWKGYLYVALLFGTASVRTMILSQHLNQLFLFGLKIRTALIAAIYKKSLRMSIAAKKEKTIGEIVNLMSVDCQKFIELSFHVNMAWSAPLQIIIALYFLWGQLGPSVLAGLVVLLVLIPINSYIASKLKVFQVKQMKLKDERVKLMNETLNGIKIIKLYAWETNFEDQIGRIRKKEVNLLKKFQLIHAGSMFIFSCTPFLVSLASFVTYVLVDEKNVLDAQTAFVSLSLFNILRGPLFMLPNVITSIVQLSVSLKRINSFMATDELNSSMVEHDQSEKVPLLIERGTFSWDNEPVLKNINLRFCHGDLVAVVGVVGSGKSTLISAFLGETNKISGRVNVLGSVAYVPQQAWMQNASLRENILFGKPFNQKFYDQVIEACSLKSDINILPALDETEIGEKGINLSGGQKQRVSLARAIYADADIYFLDDPLSAVDSHVGKHIFDNVLGPNGLLKNKTRVLVTHGATYLPDVGQIVVLKDGVVSEIGTYVELLERKGAFADFLVQYVSEISEEGDEKILEELQRQLSNTSVSEEINKTLNRQRSLSNSDKNSTINRSKTNIQRQTSVTSTISTQKSTEKDLFIEPGKEKIKGKIIQKEQASQGNVKLVVYKHYFMAVGFVFCLFILLFNIGKEAFTVGSTFVINLWTEDTEQMLKNGTVSNSKRDLFIGLYGTFGILQAFFSFLTITVKTIGCVHASIYIHNTLLKSVMRWPLNVFDVTPLGRILNRFSSDIQTVDSMLPMNIEMLLMQVLKVISTITVITYTTPIFVSVMIPIGIIYFLIQRLYVATSRQLKRLESISRSPIYSHFSETITGVVSIRAFKAQARFIKESESKVDFNQICFYPSNIANRWLAIRLEMVGNLIILFASLFAILGNQSAGLVGLSVTYALQITFSLNMLVRVSSDIETNIVAVERVKEYQDVSQEAAWEITNKRPPKFWPEYGTVEFRNYSTRYRPGLDLVLNGINFLVSGGEKVGIVGRTGAGKSSLTLALFRIIEAAEGEILIDGLNIASIGLHDLRSHLTIIPQEAILFSGSLRMNLDPFGKHSDEELWNALELCHLKSFVKGLAAGLNHDVSEGGDNLSMGQKQLICLGRALLRKTKILVLDEATAAVDLETDDLIQQTIRQEFKECTVLTIAHRLNTIIDYDKVLVLDKGRIAEFDSPNNLLTNSESLFYGMAKDAGLV